MNTSEKQKSENGRSYELRYIMDQKTTTVILTSATWMQKSTAENVYRKAKKAAKKLDSKNTTIRKMINFLN